MYKEPTITIEGVEVDNAMALVIRVAIERLDTELEENGLSNISPQRGDDNHAATMTHLYRKSVRRIRELMVIKQED